MSSLLECRDLVKAYGDHTVVDEVGFSIAEGEAYGLLGPNGAGKTTTISMLVGLLAPDAGSVTVAGVPVADDPIAAKRLVGFVPQEIALYPELSARENLRFFGRLYGLGRSELSTRIDELLEMVSLADRADDRVGHYSGGMKRRANIAVALLHQPRLLILDEPTVGVDPQSRAAILDQVERWVADGMSLLYTSHYMEEVERVCTRVGIIDRGRLVADGTRRELVAELGGTDRVELVLDGDIGAAAEKLRTVQGITEAVVTGPTTVQLLVIGGRTLLPGMLEAVSGSAAVTGVEVIEPDLEAAFLHLTGSTLRD
ncbi:ABC transporter ATP-binding protein [Isoptericola croceus]|uniref:ABC transporter ATP-binding protein n=1 Tax=Isoptericola croceus TaxID=3031406 RepID=UPI0023F8A120|nr:ABC transporter ATP-binding protein [Isoptericola croceus]